jgi:NADH/NAD ratio-sensing transcriptional regulator Rex
MRRDDGDSSNVKDFSYKKVTNKGEFGYTIEDLFHFLCSVLPTEMKTCWCACPNYI